jgi:hypothetical protein
VVSDMVHLDSRRPAALPVTRCLVGGDFVNCNRALAENHG